MAAPAVNLHKLMGHIIFIHQDHLEFATVGAAGTATDGNRIFVKQSG
jgi:hypothetical protein